MIKLHRVQPLLPGQYSVRQGGGTRPTVAVACPFCGAVSAIEWPFRLGCLGSVPDWLCSRCGTGGDLELVDYAEPVVGEPSGEVVT